MGKEDVETKKSTVGQTFGLTINQDLVLDTTYGLLKAGRGDPVYKQIMQVQPSVSPRK